MIGYSLPGTEDAIRKKLYRSVRSEPTAAQRRAGAKELAEKLASFKYEGQPCPSALTLSSDKPVRRLLQAVPRPRRRPALQQRRLLGPADPGRQADRRGRARRGLLRRRGLQPGEGLPRQERHPPRAPGRLQHRHVRQLDDLRLREPARRTSTSSWSATRPWPPSPPTTRRASPPRRRCRSRRWICSSRRCRGSKRRTSEHGLYRGPDWEARDSSMNNMRRHCSISAGK